MKLRFLSVAFSLLLASTVFAQHGYRVPQSEDQSLDPTLLQGFGGSGGGARAGVECDDFDRANGAASASGSWTDMSGTILVDNNQVWNGGGGNQWMQHNTASCPYDQSVTEFDLAPNPTGASGYAAFVTGIGSDQLYTKIQNQTGQPGYSNYGFYHGFNGGGFGTYGGFFSFTAQIDSNNDGAHVRLRAINDVMTMEIDDDLDGVYELIVDSVGTVAGAGLASALGDGHGYGGWSDGRADNWSLNGGCTGGGVFRMSVRDLIAGGVTTITTAGATPGGLVGIGYSVAGGGPTTVNVGPCGSVTADLSTPVLILGTFTATGNGTTTTTANVPPGTTGISVWFQALDVGTCALSAGLAELIG